MVLLIGFLIVNPEDRQYLVIFWALTTCSMWIKFMYFLRLFKGSGYLMRMIVTVIRDMGTLLLFLLIGMVTFSDAFIVIAKWNQTIDGAE